MIRIHADLFLAILGAAAFLAAVAAVIWFAARTFRWAERYTERLLDRRRFRRLTAPLGDWADRTERDIVREVEP